MNKRILYSILFAVPGFFISMLIAFFVLGVVYGFLWIYHFGDNRWLPSGEQILPAFFTIVFLTIWIIFIIIGYNTGRGYERDPVSSRKHILISTGITITSILLIIFHQFSVGNIGPKSDSILCSDFCKQKGYAGSGMPAKDTGESSCSCYDNSGREVIKIPANSMDSAQ